VAGYRRLNNGQIQISNKMCSSIGCDQLTDWLAGRLRINKEFGMFSNLN
jgi:hypothetical protein